MERYKKHLVLIISCLLVMVILLTAPNVYHVKWPLDTPLYNGWYRANQLQEVPLFREGIKHGIFEKRPDWHWVLTWGGIVVLGTVIALVVLKIKER